LKTGVLVIGNHVQALGVIRSLGRRNIPVYLVNDRSLCISRFSKYLRKFIKIDITNDSEFVDSMIKLATKENTEGWILMPTNDIMVYILSRYKSILEEYYRVSTPSWDVIKYAYDKKLTYELAKKSGVPTPKTVYPKDFDDVVGIASNLEYPLIIKGINGYTFYRKTKVKVMYVNSKEELINAYKRLTPIVSPTEIMIQEVIPGGHVYSFCSFFKNKEVIAIWIGKKIREHPMGFGTGTFAESIYVPEIRDLGICILKAMNYYGISEIEFKRDKRDGKFKLLEINARTWLWHSLASRCGVDFPYILYRDSIEEDVSPITSFRVNVKWIHFYTDLWVSVKELIRGKLKISEYLKSLRGEKEFAVFCIDDPLPFICETLILPYLRKTR